MIDQLVELIASSALRKDVLWALMNVPGLPPMLMNVPGLPPIVQSVHIMAIAVVVASAIMIALRFLNLAVPSQSPTEMIGRLMPWAWWALAVLLTTGIVFVIAQPGRYFHNPIVLWKFSLLSGALVLTLTLHFANRSAPGFWEATAARLLAARGISFISLFLWIGVIFAGRWIAYADYIYY